MRGVYIASESTFYRVLKAAKQLQHRGKSLAPKKTKQTQQLLGFGAERGVAMEHYVLEVEHSRDVLPSIRATRHL